MRRVKVLVVDDSLTMRNLVSAVLKADPEIEVVGSASDALEARQAMKALNPDVVTLDIEMPNMNGLVFLEKIMRLRPTPVIMISSLTQRGADASIEALQIGAFDYVGKPGPGMPVAQAFSDLAEKVKAASRSLPRRAADLTAGRGQAPSFLPNGKVIAMGASTGGVDALLQIVASFPKNCPPVVVTQHMPANFTRSFAQRLDRCSEASVSEAEDGAPLKEGHIYLAPGGATHLEVMGTKALVCRLREGDLVSGHRPSVDVLFSSVARSAGAHAIGVILTGMGRDGAAGLKTMREAGAATLGQDEGTCVVYGMPKAAFDLGAVDRQVPLQHMAREILALCNRRVPVEAVA